MALATLHPLRTLRPLPPLDPLRPFVALPALGPLRALVALQPLEALRPSLARIRALGVVTALAPLRLRQRLQAFLLEAFLLEAFLLEAFRAFVGPGWARQYRPEAPRWGGRDRRGWNDLDLR